MKKLLFLFPIVVLLAAGCNSSQQTSVQTQSPVVKTPNPASTQSVTNNIVASPTTTPTQSPTPKMVTSPAYRSIITNNSPATITLSDKYSQLYGEQYETAILGQITVTAGSSSGITIKTLPITVSLTGGFVLTGNAYLEDDAMGMQMPLTSSSLTASPGNPGNENISFTAGDDDNIIAPGASKTYDVIVGGIIAKGSGSSSATLKLGTSSAIIINSTGDEVSVTNPTNQITIHN